MTLFANSYSVKIFAKSNDEYNYTHEEVKSKLIPGILVTVQYRILCLPVFHLKIRKLKYIRCKYRCCVRVRNLVPYYFVKGHITLS
jgi:hypothetical protein